MSTYIQSKEFYWNLWKAKNEQNIEAKVPFVKEFLMLFTWKYEFLSISNSRDLYIAFQAFSISISSKSFLFTLVFQCIFQTCLCISIFKIIVNNFFGNNLIRHLLKLFLALLRTSDRILQNLLVQFLRMKYFVTVLKCFDPQTPTLINFGQSVRLPSYNEDGVARIFFFK